MKAYIAAKKKGDPKLNRDVFIYRLDKADTITSVSDNWRAFADANDWNNALRPEEVVGHPLWDFIQDHETRHLYEQVFARARCGVRSLSIPFRCDSPSLRRYLELFVTALPDDDIEIISTVLRTEPRSAVPLLDVRIQRTADTVSVCSICKKIRVSGQQWSEIEEGLVMLRLFESDGMPQLSHGLRPVCCESMMKVLD